MKLITLGALCVCVTDAVVDHHTILQYLCQGHLRAERRLSEQVDCHYSSDVNSITVVSLLSDCVSICLYCSVILSLLYFHAVGFVTGRASGP